MSEPDKHKSRAWIWWCAFGLFVLYPLSFGPAKWIVSTTRIGQEPFFVIYAPLMLLAEMLPFVYRALTWYCDLWRN